MVISFFKKIRNIIVGNWRNLTGYTSDETKRRRQICEKCEHNVMFATIKVCELCGCPIQSKTTVKSEKCLNNKW